MKTTDKTVLSVANDLIENGVDLNGYELIVTIEKQPLNEYLHKEYEETKKRLIALRNALNDIGVDGMARERGKVPIELNELTLQEQCKAILNTLEEPYRTEALENFDSEFFEKQLHSFNRTKSRALLLSFEWKKSNLRIAEYYNKLISQGE